MNSIEMTYSIIEFESHCFFVRRQCKPSLRYKWLFSHSNSLSNVFWVLKKNMWKWRFLIEKWSIFVTFLLKHITGHNEHPRVQQQQIHPQKSHRALTGKVFFRTAFTRLMDALNSSGATRDVSVDGNSVLNRLLSPNLEK